MSLSAELRRAGWVKLQRVGVSGGMQRTRIISVRTALLFAAGVDPDVDLAGMWLPVERDGELMLRILPLEDVLKMQSVTDVEGAGKN